MLGLSNNHLYTSRSKILHIERGYFIDFFYTIHSIYFKCILERLFFFFCNNVSKVKYEIIGPEIGNQNNDGNGFYSFWNNRSVVNEINNFPIKYLTIKLPISAKKNIKYLHQNVKKRSINTKIDILTTDSLPLTAYGQKLRVTFFDVFTFPLLPQILLNFYFKMKKKKQNILFV